MQSIINQKASEYIENYINHFKTPVRNAFVAGAKFVKENLIVIIARTYDGGYEQISNVSLALNMSDAEKIRDEILKSYKMQLIGKNVDLQYFSTENTESKVTYWDDSTGEDSITIEFHKETK